jgi:ubiquinone/menaquinone biosynthesis C-methylase UbiE
VSPTNRVDNRQERERRFHDRIAGTLETEHLLVREAFESPTALENRFALGEMGDLSGQNLLDLGCGAGETSVYFGLRGARVWACDISQKLLALGEGLAARHGTRVCFSQCDAGRLPYPDASFEVVFGNGVLHHLNLETAIPEISRVLKPGGRGLFIEPLPYNPVIQVYRKLAKEVRTPDEKPIRFKDLDRLRPYFRSVRHEEFWFLSLLIFLHFFFVRRFHPSKVRYWKKVIEEGPRYEKTIGRLRRADERLLRWLPWLKPMCWNTVIVMEK